MVSFCRLVLLMVPDINTHLKVMNSQMGLKPLSAAPTAKPVKPASVMGVSITLRSPNLSKRPFVIL